MFIELGELLACPAEHDPAYCVIGSDEMEGRRLVRGKVGCPICEAEYPIENGVVEFGPDPLLGRGSRADDLTREEMPTAGDLCALLALSGPGGYVGLLGSPARLAGELSATGAGIHFVGVNAPPEVLESEVLSLLRCETAIPLRTGSLRGIVVGKEYCDPKWLAEAARVLLKGLRLVAIHEDVTVDGVDGLASGRGLWVGKKGG